MPFDYCGRGYINSDALCNLEGATAQYSDWQAAPSYDYGDDPPIAPWRYQHLGTHGQFEDIIVFIYESYNSARPIQQRSRVNLQLFWKQNGAWQVAAPQHLPRETNSFQTYARFNARVLEINGVIYLVVLSLFDRYTNNAATWGVHLLRLNTGGSQPTLTHLDQYVYGINDPGWYYNDLRFDANILRWSTANQFVASVMHYSGEEDSFYPDINPDDAYRVDFFLLTVTPSETISLTSGPLVLWPGEHSPYKTARAVSVKNSMFEFDAAQRQYVSVIWQDWNIDTGTRRIDATAVLTFASDFSAYQITGYVPGTNPPDNNAYQTIEPYIIRANNNRFGVFIDSYFGSPYNRELESMQSYTFNTPTTPPSLVARVLPRTLYARWTERDASLGFNNLDPVAQLRFADRGGLAAMGVWGSDFDNYIRGHALLDIMPTDMALEAAAWLPDNTYEPEDTGAVATDNNRAIFIGQDENKRHYFRTALYCSGSVMPPYIAWDAASDLPTEDISRPSYARRGMNISVYRPDELPDSVMLTNPVEPSANRWRAVPIASSVDGARMRYALEGIEARWQRARPKRDLINNNPQTLKQALENLLTARQTEFPWLAWETIPEIYWPDGTIPQIPGLQVVVDADDPQRPSIYDEVLDILAAAPGYTLIFNVNNRLELVVPAFAPNAPAPIALTTPDATIEQTGYSRTELVRSVRVISRPYEASDQDIPVAPFTSIRVNFAGGGGLDIAVPQDTTPGTVDYGQSFSIPNQFIDYTWTIPLYDDLILNSNSIDLALDLRVYRLVPQPGGAVTQVASFTATPTLTLDGSEQLLYFTPVGETFGLIRIQLSPLLNVLGRYNADNKSIVIRLNAPSTIFGGSAQGGFGLSFKDYYHGYRLRVEATTAALRPATQTFEGSYTNESGYFDLPDVDVSRVGINDSTVLQRLAQLIAAYRNRVATRYELRQHQPWVLHPDHIGRRVTLDGTTLILDSVRERVEFRTDSVAAESRWGCWLYEQAVVGNRLVYGADGLFYGSNRLVYGGGI